MRSIEGTAPASASGPGRGVTARASAAHDDATPKVLVSASPPILRIVSDAFLSWRGAPNVETSGPSPLASEDRFRALAEAIPQIVWTATADGLVDYCNARWFEFTGVDAAQTIGNAWATSVHPDDLCTLSAGWQRAVQSHVPFEDQARYRAADGSFRWMLIRAVAVFDDNGRVDRWLGTSTDIDAQKRGESALKFLADASVLLTSASASDVTTTLDRLVRLAVPAIAERCCVYLTQPDGSLRCAGAEDAVDDARLHETAARVVETGRSLVRPAEGGEDALIVVPLITCGAPFGAIVFAENKSERLLGDTGLQLAELVARRTATSIESARLFERERRTARHLRYLAEAGNILSTSLDLQATLDALSSVAVPELADIAIVTLRSVNGQPYVAATAFADPLLEALAEGLIGQAYMREFVPLAGAVPFESGRPRIVGTVDEAFLESHIVSAMFPIARCISLGTTLAVLPLVSNGTLLGSLSLYAACNDVRRAYTDFDIPFLEELGQRGARALAHALNYGREHRVADMLQKASLPVSLPNVPGLRFSCVYEPGKSEAHIGGDWYDALRLSDGRVVISIGDVAGSGLEAAVTMSNLRHVLRGVAQIDADPITLLTAADKTLRAEGARMVTAFVGVLDPITLTLTYASAGHPAPYVRTPCGSIRQLPCSGLPLGLRERDEAPARTIVLEPGALLLLYTDGLTEATRNIEEGERRIEAALDDDAILRAPDVARAIHDAVLGFKAAGDDVAMLAVEVARLPIASYEAKRIWRWSVASANAESMLTTRRALFRTLRKGGMLAADCETAELVAGELLSNVKRHAPGNVDVVLDWSGTAPVLNVLDSGVGFEYRARLPSDDFSESGRGLFLVSALAEHFNVCKREAGGSHARAVLAVGRGRS